MRFQLFLLFVLMCGNIHGQYRLSGYIFDTDKKPLPYATVLVLNQKDSMTVAYGVTNLNGRYDIDVQEKGTYNLKYSYVGFSDQWMSLTSNWDTSYIQIQNVILESSTVELGVFNIVSDRIPIKTKGDTIQYNSESYKVPSGSDVEQLLKKLPGFDIDPGGNIIVHGKRVEKILVDGKEFFGNDLKVATKNLEAEAVKFVEVTDKKSDEAVFTSQEEDNDTKVINLTLKKEYKAGDFGKVYLGAGTNETYKGKINYNIFNKNTRLSIIGNANNINERISPNLSGIHSYRFNVVRGITSNEGVRSSWSPGVNLNQKLSEKLDLQVSYYYNENQTKLVKNIATDNFAGDTVYHTSEDILMDETDKNHSFKTRLKWKPDSRTLINLENNFLLFEKYFGGDSKLKYTSASMKDQMGFSRNLSNTFAEGVGSFSRISLTHKLKKEGRNVSIIANLNQYQEKTGTNIQNQVLGAASDQIQNFGGNKTKFNVEGYFIEPLNRFWNVRMGHQLIYESEEQNRYFGGNETIDSVVQGVKDRSFVRAVTENKSTIVFRKKQKKIRYAMGVSISDLRLKSLEISRNFQFILPMFSVKYFFKNSQYLKLNYRANNLIPRLEQLIDMPDNTNVQRTYVGNPNLKPEYGHSLNMNYFYFDPVSTYNVFVGVQVSQMNHKIMNQTTIHPDLTTSISAINLGAYQNLGLIGGVTGPIKKLKVIYNVSPKWNWSRSSIILSAQETKVQTSSYFLDFSIRKYKKEKWDYKIGASWHSNETHYPSQKNLNKIIQNYSWYGHIDYNFLKGVVLELDYKFQRFATMIPGQKTEFHYINASLKKVIKNKWVLSLIANDILNQNTGIRTVSNLNQINTTQYNIVNQYFMIAIEYKLGNRSKK